ncbi:MAG: hypothetical protein ACK2UT_07050 [Candidatus Promineifilaceae bacterium]
MKISKLLLELFSAALLFLWLLPEGTEAQDGNRAALVIRMNDQDVQTACVEFSEPQISGFDLLQQSGIEFAVDIQSMGAKICSIEQTGCPADDCWCQCKGGGDCIYWSYWHRLNEQWHYSQGGASTYSLGDGDVEGWSWGPGSVNEAIAPPELSFADICRSPPEEASLTGAEPAPFIHRGTNGREPADTAVERELDFASSAYQTADLGLSETSSETYPAKVNEQKNSSSLFSYVIFCLIVISLAGLLMFSTIRGQVKQS